MSARAQDIAAYLRNHGATFFAAVHDGSGGGFPRETVDALWELVWRGLITNDTYHPVRTLLFSSDKERVKGSTPYQPPGSPGFAARMRARRSDARFGEGRWSSVRQRITASPTPAEWSAAIAQQLLVRNGIAMRETAAAEEIPGGYAAVYPALKTMEESGWIRGSTRRAGSTSLPCLAIALPGCGSCRRKSSGRWCRSFP